MLRELPIVDNGALHEDATFLTLGYMLYPEDPRAAQQWAAIARNEFPRPEGTISTFMNQVNSKQDTGRFSLMGEMTLIICHFIRERGKPFKKQAAHVVSENHATDKRQDGKALATSATPIERTFRDYSAVSHLWAALWFQQCTNSPDNFEDMLFLANMILRVLHEPVNVLKYEPWRIPQFEGFQVYEWPDDGLISNPDAITAHLESYKSKSGR